MVGASLSLLSFIFLYFLIAYCEQPKRLENLCNESYDGETVAS
jgi:hypothetical protein